MSERVFTQEELAEMGARTLDLIIEAIDNDDKERAKKLSQRMYREFLSMHDLYRDWLTASLSFIGKRYGDEVLYQASYEGIAAFWKPLVELYNREDVKGDVRRKARLLAAGLRGHLHPRKIEEDEEKFTITSLVCPSGGRQLLEGSYDGPPKDFIRVRKPQPMTYGREDFPVYCTHDAIMEMIAIDLAGAPVCVIEPSAKLGEEPCRLYLYKDPNAVPAKFYERVGRKKKAKGL